MINQPDVALTDFGLAIESVLFAYLLWRGSPPDQRLARWFALLFLFTGLGALAGGAVHGFFPDERSPFERILWPLSLMAVAAAAMALWALGALIGFDEKWSRRIRLAAQVEFAVYCVAIVRGRRAFDAAVLNYLPAAIFLLMVLVKRWRSTRDRGYTLGTMAMVLTFVAAYVQAARIDWGAKALSYNALYHLIQAAALPMLFFGAQRIIAERRR